MYRFYKCKYKMKIVIFLCVNDKKSTIFFTVTNFPHFELLFMVFGNEYRAEIFFILNVRPIILSMSILSSISYCLFFKTSKKCLGSYCLHSDICVSFFFRQVRVNNISLNLSTQKNCFTGL